MDNYVLLTSVLLACHNTQVRVGIMDMPGRVALPITEPVISRDLAQK